MNLYNLIAKKKKKPTNSLIFKMAKDLKTCSKEDIQMANRHIKDVQHH